MDTTRRITRQRRVILEELSKVKTHPTADEVYGMVRGKLFRISLGTVYRNLSLLAEEGLVRIIPEPGGRKHFDADISRHSHIRCLRCGRVGDIAITSAPDIKPEAAGRTEFRLLGYRLDFVGLCPACAETTFRTRELPAEYGDYKPVQGGSRNNT